MEYGEVTLSLDADEALVLFDLLSRYEDDGKLEIYDQAERHVLWGLLAELEGQLVTPLNPNYRELLQAARERVRSGADGAT